MLNIIQSASSIEDDQVGVGDGGVGGDDGG